MSLEWREEPLGGGDLPEGVSIKAQRSQVLFLGDHKYTRYAEDYKVGTFKPKTAYGRRGAEILWGYDEALEAWVVKASLADQEEVLHMGVDEMRALEYYTSASQYVKHSPPSAFRVFCGDTSYLDYLKAMYEV